jgi:hypothetical protein
MLPCSLKSAIFLTPIKKPISMLENSNAFYSMKVPCNIFLLQTCNRHSQAAHWMDNQTQQSPWTLEVFLPVDSMLHWCFHSNGWRMSCFDEHVGIFSWLCSRWDGICVVCNMTFKTESHTCLKKNISKQVKQSWNWKIKSLDSLAQPQSRYPALGLR